MSRDSIRSIWKGLSMIVSFKHKGLKLLYNKGDPRKLPANMVAKITLILTALDAAMRVEEMDLPTFRLHSLTGNRKGEWSVTVRANWRIVFEFENSNAFNVSFEDYH